MSLIIMMKTMTTMIMMTTTTSTAAKATTRNLFGSRLLRLDLACCLFGLVCSDKEYRRNGDLHSTRPYPLASRVHLQPKLKLPDVRSTGPSTLENPNPAVTSGQIPSFPTTGAFANIFSFRVSCPPYEMSGSRMAVGEDVVVHDMITPMNSEDVREGSRPVTTRVKYRMSEHTSCTGILAESRVLNAGHLFQQLSTKHKEIKHTRCLLSLCAIPRSATRTSMSDISLPPVPLTYPHHLLKPRVGPLSLKICIFIGEGHLMSKRGSGRARERRGRWCLASPEHQFHVLKSARPTWIMKSTWQKRYRRGVSFFGYYYVLCDTDEVSSAVSV